MKDLLQEYYQCFSADPFADSTTEKGEDLMAMLADERSERWINLVEELDLARDSSKEWKLVKRLNGEKSSIPLISKITPNETGSQLVENGKPPVKVWKCEIERAEEEEVDYLVAPFSILDVAGE